MSNDERKSMFDAQMRRETLLRRALIGSAALLPGAELLARTGSAIAASNQSFSPPSTPTGTFNVANPAEPNFIDPAQALEIQELDIVRAVYDGLVEWNHDYSALAPALATSWSTNKDATKWTFVLRQGVKFHDGAAFDATAARKTIEYYKGKTWGDVFSTVTKVDDSNPNVLVIYTSKPAPDFDRDQAIVKMISPTLIAANQVNQRAVGTGAYMFKQWNKGQSVILSANPNYWGKDGPYFQEINLQTIPDQTSAINALEAGQIDLVMQVPAEQLAQLQKNSKFSSSSTKAWFEGHAIFRTDQKPVNDVRVRQAVAYGLDRQELVAKVLLGRGVVATSPIPFGCYGHVDPPTKYSHDPDKAKALLKAAGYSNGLSINLAVTSDAADFAQAMAGQLSEAGFNIHVNTLEPGVFVKDLTSNHPTNQMFRARYGWVDGSAWHFTVRDAIQHPRWTAAPIVPLINEISTTADGPKRLKLLAQLQNDWMEQLPHLPIFDGVLSDVFTAKLKGYQTPKDGYEPVFTSAYKTS